jgi:hypothetical protein
LLFIIRFILKDKAGIKADLIETIESNEKEIIEQAVTPNIFSNLQKFKQHFEGKQKELEKQLKEMVSSLKF